MSLIHTFKTEENYYIYDGFSNKIFNCDKFTFELANQINHGKAFEDSIKSYGNGTEIQEIEELKNIFYKSDSHRIEGLSPPMPYSKFSSLLSKNLDTITLEVTTDCNFRCGYCVYSKEYSGWRSHGKEYMSIKTAKSLIDLLSRHSSDSEKVHIGFYGGEPLLNFKVIKEVVKYSNSLFDKIQFSLTTNGYGLKLEDIREFLIQNRFLIHVSLDGPRDIHDLWRRTLNSIPTFEAIYSALKRIRDYDELYYYEKIGFHAVLTPSSDLLKVDEFFSGNSLVKDNELTASFVGTEGFPKHHKTKESRKNKILELESKFISSVINKNPSNSKLGLALFQKPLRVIHHRNMKSLGKNEKANGICIPGKQRLFADVSGRLFIFERVGHSITIGDKDSGINIRKIENLIRKYCEMSIDDCRDCWAIRLCGLCFANVIDKNGLNMKKKRRSCERMKKLLDQSLRIYCSIMEKNPISLDFL